MPMRPRNPIPGGPQFAAALDEMNFWIPDMADHAKFIRGGVDPSEESIFRAADAFAVRFDRLQAQVRSTSPADTARINFLMDTSITETVALRDLKEKLAELAGACGIASQLPAELFDHMRREADFFLTMLFRLRGQPGPPRDVLGIPDGNIPTAVAPKSLIPHMGGRVVEVARDENLYWLKIHSEHGEVLPLIAYRPRVQEELYAETSRFGRELGRLLAEAAAIPLNPRAFRDFGRRVYPVMAGWRDFLRSLHRRVLQCDVPTGQINAPALMLDHMAREAEYYLEVLQLLDSALV